MSGNNVETLRTYADQIPVVISVKNMAQHLREAADQLEMAAQLAVAYDDGRVQDYEVGVKLMEIFGLVP